MANRPMKEWLRVASPAQRARLAELAGCSENTLYRLAQPLVYPLKGGYARQASTALSCAVSAASYVVVEENEAKLPENQTGVFILPEEL